jgi:hypothetical protein
MTRAILLAVTALAFILVPRQAMATSCNTCLGKPTKVLSPTVAFPLSGFVRMKGMRALTKAGKPEVLFIGTQLQGPRFFQDMKSAVERWPLVKALEQFGTFSGIKRMPRVCIPEALISSSVCQIESYNWHGATYRSRYVTFAAHELIGLNGKPLDGLSGQDLTLYDRYSRRKGSFFKHDPLDALHTLLPGGAPSMHTLPLVVIGSYEQTIDQIVVPGVFQTLDYATVATPGQAPQAYYSGLSFADIQSTLAAGKPGELTVEVNAQANVITALICHADHKKPAAVCSRSAIRRIMKTIK